MLAPELAFQGRNRKFNPRPLSKTIKLSSNENPYGPSEKVQKAVIKAFDNGCRYPRVYSNALAKKLAKLHRVNPENIIITGGSTEGLKITGLTFANGGGEIIAAKPTFLAMMDFAEQWGAKISWILLETTKAMTLTQSIIELIITQRLFFCATQIIQPELSLKNL